MRLRSTSVATVVAVAAAAAVGAGIARSTSTAPIPDANGVIHACYKKPIGPARIVFSAADCGRGEAPLEWSQAGPAGPQGRQGPEGPAGPQGPPGPAGGAVQAFQSPTLVYVPVEGDHDGIVVHSLLLGDPGTYWVTATGTMTERDGSPAGFTRGRCQLLLGATGPLPFTVLDSADAAFNGEYAAESTRFTLVGVVDVEQAGRRLEILCRRFSADPVSAVEVSDLRINALRAG